MQVKLIAATVPDLPGITTAEEFIAYAARVSNPANQINSQTAPRLLKYLADNAHWSPFEMVSIVMEIVTTRDIGRQILRHRSFSFQEFSQRYAKVSTDDYILSEARLQDTKNRQNSFETDDQELQDWWMKAQRHIAEETSAIYQEALRKGIAKEVARKVLPEGLTKSTMYMSGTLRSWIHYCQLRTENGTQKEHREIATACRKAIEERFPTLSETLGI